MHQDRDGGCQCDEHEAGNEQIEYGRIVPVHADEQEDRTDRFVASSAHAHFYSAALSHGSEKLGRRACDCGSFASRKQLGVCGCEGHPKSRIASIWLVMPATRVFSISQRPYLII